MKTMLTTLLLCTALQGCAVPPTANDTSDKCPPLPTLPDNATRFEGRVFTLTLIALYEQCAKSKK